MTDRDHSGMGPYVPLSAGERARLHPGVNADALEHLLRALPPEMRPFVVALASDNPPETAEHQRHGGGEASHAAQRAGARPAHLPRQLADLEFEDPHLRELLAAALHPTGG
jgi:hypothetical protein